jgi:4-oxalocrotonate tautomerase
MPWVNVKVIEGVFSDAQKRELVEKISEAVIAIEGENMRPATVVVIEEVKSGDWAIGGRTMSTDDAKALAAGTLVQPAARAPRAQAIGRASRLPRFRSAARPRIPKRSPA